MLSLLLLTCSRGITWTSLRVRLGWLGCMGTDWSMLFRYHIYVLQSNLLMCGRFGQCIDKEGGVLFNAKLHQIRRINSRIVRSKHRLQILQSHIRSGTLPKGYSPKINPAIGSNSQEFQND